MKTILLFSTCVLLFSACETVFLGDNEENTVEHNFELFWTDFDEHYGLFEARGWDWDSVYTANRPNITSTTTDEELWNTFREMIAYLDDSHTFIYDPAGRRQFVSGSELDDLVETEFSIDLIKSRYLESSKAFPGTNQPTEYFTGKVTDKNIGYIFLQGIDLDNPGRIDDVLGEFATYDALIFDIRNNGGGDDLTAEALAGRFADREQLVYTVQEKTGPAPLDFSEKIEYFTRPTGKTSFQKPVMLLTDRVTVSAAEIFTLHMKAFEHVVQLGDSTAGDFSDTSMRRFLPNGWQYQYSIMMYLLPDGQSLDGIGHVPDVYARNTAADIAAGNDLVFERALAYLQENHGIN